MTAINSILTTVLGIIFLPFRGVAPWIGLAVISVLVGLMLVFIFKTVSNQDAISRVKDKIRGCFLEIRLFQDDLGMVMRAFGNIFITNFIYMRYALVPMLVMFIPISILLVQVENRYGLKPYAVGDSVMLTVKVAGGSENSLDAINIELPEGVVKTAGPVHMPATGEVAWRLEVKTEGEHELKVLSGQSEYSMKLLSGVKGVPLIARKVTSESFFEQFLNPAAPPPPAESGIASISLDYPAREIEIAGLHIHWLLFFFIVSIGFGFSVKGFFGVQV